MLDVVNRFADGFVAIPVIAAARRHGILAALADGVSPTALGANSGHLGVAVRTLVGLGWLEAATDGALRLTAAGATQIPDDVGTMLADVARAAAGDGAALEPWLRRCVRDWSGTEPIAGLLEGALLAPVLVQLHLRGGVSALNANADPFAAGTMRALFDLFVARGWADPDSPRARLNAAGRFLVESGAKLAVVVSYWPMLQRIDELLIGDAAAVFARDPDGHESHLDRRLNVAGSASQHGSFFREMEDAVVSYFDGLPLDAQPTHIADLGCGDGSLLKRLHAAVAARTGRGKVLASRPLTLIAADFNEASLDEARRGLAGLPHLTIQADIGDPADFVARLAAKGVDPDGVLHVRSFVDHDRPLLAPRDAAALARRDRVRDAGVHVDEAGALVPPAVAVQSLVEHLARWADVAAGHGLLVLEVHCLRPATIHRLNHATEALHFDAYHGFARQHLVEAPTFLLAAAESGLRAHSRTAHRFPRLTPYTRITLNRFTPAPYRIRLAVEDDVPALLALENAALDPTLRDAPAQVRRRLANFPEGQLVAERDGEVIGALFSQRIADPAELGRVTADTVETLHRDDGPIGQLLWLIVHPERRDRIEAEALLDFALDYFAAMDGIRGVAGVTRCRDYARRQDRSLSHAAYVAQRDERGLPLDPILLMHASHGARLESVLEGYRPRDVDNGGDGVLIAYQLEDRHAAAAGAPAPGRASGAQASGHDIERIVRAAVERVLGAARRDAFQADRPLMEMGLESLDLLELRRSLSETLGRALDPTFFFRHGTPQAVVRELSGQNAAATQPVRAVRAAPTSERELDDHGFAIVGLACRMPGGAADAAAFWRLLAEGRDGVMPIEPARWQIFEQGGAAIGDLPRDGALLSGIDRFDAAFFQISPREAMLLDPRQRLLLETVWHALEDAAIAPEALAGSATGLFLGVMGNDYETLLLRADAAGVDGHYATGTACSIAAGRLSHFFDWHGPAVSIDTACSSSLVAVHQACRALRAGDCGVAVAAGVNLTLAGHIGVSYLRAGMLSPDGRCKTFDASANGYGRGEGVGVVVLKRLADARRDGDRVLAILRGSAINQDGTGIGLTAPNETAQRRLIEAALADADVAASDVSYLEAHGTGTSLGDPIEVGAAASALGVGRGLERPLLLGSVKANIGHLEAAAGIAGLIKVVLSLQADELPGQVHFRTPNPHISWSDLPVSVVRSRQAWPAGRRIAGVSSFGFSGTNAHVVVEGAAEPVPPAAELPARGTHLLVLSAKSSLALTELGGRYAEWLAGESDADLSDLCFTASVGRGQLSHRAAIVGETRAEFSAGLAALRSGEAHAAVRQGHRRGMPRVAVLFTGQGSQWAGMADGLMAEPVFRATLEECCAAVDALGVLGQPLASVLLAAPGTAAAALLDDTAYTQPSLYALQTGLWALWRSWGLEASAVLGHSVGEFAAAYAAGVLDLADGARLVAQRGALMSALPAGGAMAAVFASADKVRAALTEGPSFANVSLGAENGTHCVVSGVAAEVDALVARFAAAGVRCSRLVVSHAFHSALLEPMLDGLEAAAKTVEHRSPQLSLISNVSGTAFAAGEAPDAAYWRGHARAPVRYAAGVAALSELGAEVLLELGPRPVLGPLALGCWPAAAAPVALSSLRPGVAAERALTEAVGGLFAAGARIDFSAREAGRGGRRIALPAYPFEPVRHWIEAPRRTASAAGHPLLGVAHRSASGETGWTQTLSAGEPGWTADHTLFGTVVAPGALHACLAAASEGKLPVAVRSGQIHAPLVLGEAPVAVQLLVAAPDGSGVRGWRVFGRSADAASDAPWRLFASGELAPAGAPHAMPALPALVERNVEEFYAAVAALGIGYGPSFSGIERLWSGAGAARGAIAAPEGMVGGSLHPAVLDACLQVMLAAVPEAALSGDPYVPLGWESIVVRGAAPRRVVCEAVLRGGVGETAEADLWLRDASGAVFAEVRGLLLKRASRAALLGAAADLDSLLYEVEWREVPEPVVATAAAPGAIAASVQPELAALASEAGFDAGSHAALEALLARAARAFALAGLRRLGWTPRIGETVEANALRVALGVLPEHARLFARLLGLLGEAGLLSAAGKDSWQVIKAELEDTPAAVAAAAASAGLDEAIAWVLLSRCGSALAEVLRGATPPLGLLFPEQGVGAADLYSAAPMSKLMNGLLAASVQRMVAGLPAGRRLRVLEVGAGTGGATSAVLPLLPAERTTYVYTDVSAGFFGAAERRFAAYPFVDYRVLDVERDPAGQGFAAGGYDLVLASNVVHATRDLVATASHCRGLLAPGGTLVLLEEMQRRGWVDLTFGLLEGWWRFTDATLRPQHALLDATTWPVALASAGFAEVALLHPDEHQAQGVVLASVAADQPGGVWLLAADAGGAAERLAKALTDKGQRAVLAPAGGVGAGAVSYWRALLAELPPLRGVVHLAALDAALADTTTTTLAADTAAVAGSALALAQALIGKTPSAGLWLVTEGAQVVAGEPGGRLAGATLWGMARTLAHEHPELNVRRLDLEMGGDIAAVLDELLAPDAEDEIARRGGVRLAPRLVRAGRDAERLALPGGSGWRLAKGSARTLAGLGTEAVEPHAPGAGEVQVAVAAAGLNFRDVLDALGMVPVDAGPLGGEFAGRVVAVGEGVTHLAPGDAVVGLGVGCFAPVVTTAAALVARCPDGLAPAAAAGLPIVFVTAALAFEWAGLRSGDRVLIHAGAGGVGLAAIQLAQAAGAEVFATASAGKQAYLRGLGVRHVFDSRTTGFGAEILAATGGRGVDVVLNSLTGEGFIAASLAALAPGGRFVEIAKRGIWTDAEMAAARPDLRYHVLAVDRLQAEQPALVGDALRAVLARLATGELRPLPYSAHPIGAARSAMRHMQQARHIGKLVLTLPTPTNIRPNVSYLITGGLGGLGLAVADWLAARGATHLVLAGRRGPDAAAEASVAALRQRGVTVELLLADVSRAEQVDRLIAEIDARLPPLAGVIHAAGLLRDASVANQDWAGFAEVLGPKQLGGWELHLATQDRALDLFVLFASTAGVLGNRGQANHAAANNFLDQLARHRRSLGLSGLSIDWGAWSEIGEAAERRDVLEAALAAAGIGWMTPAQGLAALERALGGEASQLAVVAADWPRVNAVGPAPLFNDLLAAAAAPVVKSAAPAAQATTSIAQQLARTAPAQRRNLLIQWLGSAVQAILRLPDPPDTTAGFTALGVDSLMAVELRNQINTQLRLDPPLPATVLFDSPTVVALAEAIGPRLAAGDAPAPAALAPLVTATAATDDTAVAVVGLAARLPGAPDAAAYWRLLVEGRDAIVDVPRDRFDIDAWHDPDPEAAGKIAARRAGFIDKVDLFDAAFFGISPREAASMDPQQRVLLETAWQALEDAAIAPERLVESRTGVFVGLCSVDYLDLLKAAGPDAIDAYRGTGTLHSVAAGRLSYALGLQGPAMVIDTACSSSLVAVHQACQSLRAGECDAALAGGVNLILAPEMMVGLSRARMLAPDGRCKTFDASADGFGRGEGVGVVVLKRLADAERDGDRVLAIVRGSAVNQDGASGGLTVPNGPAQQKLITAALLDAGISASDVSYLEAHGTGTSLGDPIEVGAAASALGVGRGLERPLLLGSVKANIGHLEAAAGIAGLIKVVLSLQADELPGQVHFRTPNPHISWSDLPVSVVRSRQAWPAGRRIAGVSSFGFSGTNAHVVVEGAAEPVPPAAELPARGTHLLVLSAKSSLALTELGGRYAEWLAGESDADLSDLCFTASVGRGQLSHRAAIVGETRAEFSAGLAALRSGEAHAAVRQGHRRGMPRVAVLFTGQGSQWAGMADGLMAEPVFRATLEECCAAVDALGVLGQPLASVLLAAPGTAAAALLDDTAYTQPSLYALQTGLWALWRSWGLEASAVLGHSVGEFAAAYAAGVLDLADGARLVAQRGALMSALPAGGAMAAVFASADKVRAALTEGPSFANVSLGAENGTHCVVSGVAAEVDALVARFAAAGVRCSRLVVSHAFHSALLEPMLDGLEAAAKTVEHRSPQLSLISNVSGTAFAAGEAPDAAYWRGHARAPVRYAAGVAALSELGAEVLLELGPRPVLGPLALGCWPAAAAPVALSSLRPGVAAERALTEAVGGLFAAGARIDFSAREAGRGGRRIALPAYPFEPVRHWIEAPRRTASAAGHPLLGVAHRSASGETGWTQTLSAGEPGWTADHTLFGTVVAPGALHACLAAASEGKLPVAVRSGQIHAPLVLGEAPVAVQLLVAAPDGSGVRGWRVFGRSADGASDAPWRLFASGELAPAGAPHAMPALPALVERNVEEFYAAVAALGIGYGPSFSGIERLWSGAGAARGAIAAPEGMVGGSLHPAVLDACLQVMLAAVPEAALSGDPYVPLGWESIVVRGAAPRRVVCEAVLRGGVGETAEADLWLRDASGAVFAEVRGLLLKRASRAALLGAAADLDSLLYEVEWREVPEPVVATAAAPGAIAASVQPELAALASEAGFDAGSHAALEALLARAARAFALAGLRRLGWTPRIGETVEANALRVALGVLPEHARLFARLLGLLGEAGLLSAAGKDSWQVIKAELEDTPAAVAAAAASAGLDEAIAWVLLSRCGSALAEVLRGATPPLGLLFPEQGVGAADLYSAAPMSKLMNGLLAASVQRMVAGLPAGRRLRVLEVGAGTGGATSAVLPLLPAERTTYVYTDVSAGFFGAAERRFAAYPFVDYRVLDVERDPAGQGFAAGGYDLVLASNVVHATRDLVATASHCRGLLAPGGTLVLLEEMQRRGWVDLTFGLLEGWWRFTDATLRPQHALLDATTWPVALASAGFAEVALLHPDEHQAQGVVLASVAADQPGGVWLLAADAGGAAERLAKALTDKGQRAVLAPAGGVGAGAVSYWRALLAELPPLRGVVHLAALDAALADTTTTTLAADTAAVAGSALALAQALIGKTPSAGLWLVTEGAQVVAGEPGGRLAGATLWGMARTLAHEHPELNVRRLDLEMGGDIAAVLDELLAPDAEDEIARRGGVRLAPRLVRAGRDAERLALPGGSGWRLAKGSARTLAGLGTEAVEPHAPGAGEVQVAVAAAGLNFRDVLDALGMVPVDAGPLGGEFAGRVVAVGEGVTHLAPGDAVVGLGVGCFAPVVTTAAALVARCPDGLAPAAAAGLPIVFVTAALAFEWAGLRSGDRVLIHAGAGGVGLAAIQLAQAAGAEVFATASAGKQAYLRGLGVRHVFDSRTTGFGAEILAATGGRGVDVVLNSLTGEGFIAASLAALAPGGRFVEIAKRGIWTDAEMAAARPDLRYHVLAVDRLQAEQPALVGDALRAVLARLATGELRPLPYSAHPIGAARSAMRHMQQARHIGKLVLTLPTPTNIRPNVSYLITGGLGGLGLAVADWLAARGATHLVLAGRRGPDAAAEASVAALRQRGVTVELLLADVSRAEQVDRLIAEIDARLPPLAGVIHAAGLLRDASVANQDWAGFAEVLGPKQLGGWELHLATQDRALDLFVLFASTAGVLGNRGQANHAAANNFLDQLARHRRSLGLSGLSIDWGAWSEIGEAAERRDVLEAALAAAGIGWMTPAQGLAALERALGGEASQLAVVAADWPRVNAVGPAPLFNDLLAAAAAPVVKSAAPAAQATTSIAQQLARTAPAQRRNLLIQWLGSAVQAILRLPDPPETELRFSDLGMDSLMTVELRNRLNADLQLDPPLPASVLFDHPTLASLCDAIAPQLGMASADDDAADVPQAEPARRSEPAPRRAAEPSSADPSRSVAIIGMACRFPGAPDLAAYWRLLAEGRDAVGPIPPARADIVPPGEAAAGWSAALLDGVADFDPLHFRISPREALYIDPQQRLLLETTWHALEDAGIAPADMAGSRTGVFVGIGNADYASRHANDLAALSGFSGAGSGSFAAANRISHAFDFSGPSFAVNTACASALTALHLAVTSLQTGECDAAIVGGVNLMLHPGEFVSLSRGGVISPTGRCRSFSADADGYVRGEGCGVVVLRRLGDARAAGDRIAAVVRGSAISHVGASNGLTAPNGPAQEAVMRAAAARAGIDPASVDYLEAQGTGTPLGDAIEMGAIRNVMAPGRDPAHPLLVGAVKSNIGNLEEASGMAGLIKTVLAMRHGMIPPTLHFRELNPNIRMGSAPVRVPAALEAWPRTEGRNRLAVVHGFGYAGANAHVVLEEGEPATIDAIDPLPPFVLAVRARTPANLRRTAAVYADALAACEASELPGFCVAANTGRGELGYRLAVVGENRDALVRGLRAAAVGSTEPGLHVSGSPRQRRRRIAFLFPGAAADGVPEAISSLYETYPVCRQVIDLCTASTDGPLAGDTALFALQSALSALWESWGVRPDIVLGHEAGEMAAAVCAGVLDLEDGLELTVERARALRAEAFALAQANGGRPQSALDGFAQFAAGLPHAAAQRRLITATAQFATPVMAGDWPDYWREHARRPADLAAALQRLDTAGGDIFVEIGPQPVLLTAAREAMPARDALWLASLHAGAPARATLAEALAAVFAAGGTVDFQAVHGARGDAAVEVPLYSFERQRYWLEDGDDTPAATSC